MSGSLHRRSPDGGPALRKYSAIAALLAGWSSSGSASTRAPRRFAQKRGSSRCRWW
ncbi:hypothetical protein ACFQL4_07460 [Halosimplex aquaticum]